MVIEAPKSCRLYRYVCLMRSLIWALCPRCWSRNKESSCLNKPAFSSRGKHLIPCWFLCTYIQTLWVLNQTQKSLHQCTVQCGMLQRTILQRTNATTKDFLSISSGCHNERGGIQSADVARACAWRVRAFPLWIELQSSSLLSFVRFSYQFSSFICLLAPLAMLN